MPDFIESLRRRLVELGCPLAQVRRLVREVADHRDDLKQAAVSEGLSGADVEARANAQLGDPLALADCLMAALRQSSWWGRHFVIGFGVLPVLAVPVLWLALLLLQLSLAFTLGFGWDPRKLHAAAANPVVFRHLVIVIQCADSIAIALVTVLFCWLAQRAVVGFKWMVTACAICSLYALFVKGTITPHSFQVSVSWTPHWIEAAIPLLIAGTICVFQWRTRQRFREKVTV
jgi:hypothetical protein